MKITLAQLNPTVGDVRGNLNLVEHTFKKYAENTDLIIFPELFLVGYPPRDLLEKKWLIERVEWALERLIPISKRYPSTGLLIGFPEKTGKLVGTGLYNSAGLFFNGELIFTQQKSLLPTYDVFDEARYFDPAPTINIIKFKDEKIGISICEDAWNAPKLWAERIYPIDPIEILVQKGADILINLAASPFHVKKLEWRWKVGKYHAKRYGKKFIFVNQIGGNDELIFDGGSFCVDESGNMITSLPRFKNSVRSIDTSQKRIIAFPKINPIEEVYHALVLGIKDYTRKCGFKGVIIGLSGGIDSSLTCCLAADALGPDNVLGVLMPGPYSSPNSIDDSIELVNRIKIKHLIVPINSIFKEYKKILKPHFQGMPENVTEENIQARIRGNILMAFSNKFGYLVLSTGNKSELAVGYCTLYGDMSGGLSVLADVSKTLVYQLAEFINKQKNNKIPKSILTKPPSAELRPDQKDQDTLPSYDTLDRILYLYLDEKKCVNDIVSEGFDEDIVKWIVRKVNTNEYKRKQAAPGLKVTTKAFGMGRRIPIAAKYEI